MKILAIGDFHGKIPKKKVIEKITKILPQIDLILSPGDYSGNEEYSKILFKKIYASGKTAEEVLGKKKSREFDRKILNSGLKTIRWLSSLKKPVFGVTGNWDFSKHHEIGQSLGKEDRKNALKFYNQIKNLSNFKLIDLSKDNFKSFTIVGHTTSSYPANLNILTNKEYQRRYSYNELRKTATLRKKDYKKQRVKLSAAFNSEKNNKKTIFLTHNSPYLVLDKVSKKGHKLARNEHYGSKIVRNAILKYKPLISLCGHMHENQGIKKLGKTIVVNIGSAHDGKFSLIDLDEKRGKIIKIKLLK